MEFVENCKNLQSMLDNHRLRLRNCVKFGIDICNGLAYCHANQIYHMDLKPKNILITNDLCKLCDFGNSYTFRMESYRHQVIITLLLYMQEVSVITE